MRLNLIPKSRCNLFVRSPIEPPTQLFVPIASLRDLTTWFLTMSSIWSPCLICALLLASRGSAGAFINLGCSCVIWVDKRALNIDAPRFFMKIVIGGIEKIQ
jgi:hypothetical protein